MAEPANTRWRQQTQQQLANVQRPTEAAEQANDHQTVLFTLRKKPSLILELKAAF